MTSFSRRDFSKYFEYSYNAHGFDCADLLLMVQRDLFGRQHTIPTDRAQARRHRLSIFRQHLQRTSAPKDGDVVLLWEMGRLKADHVGTWFLIGGEPCILHTMEKTDTLFTRVRHVEDLGLKIEGIYTWNTPQ